MEQKVLECYNQIQEGLGYLMLRAKYENEEHKQYEALKKGLEELVAQWKPFPDWNSEHLSYEIGKAQGWDAALDEIKKILEGTAMADVNPNEDRRFETVSKEGNTTIMRVVSDKPQPKCYGHYKKIDPCDDNDNVGADIWEGEGK